MRQATARSSCNCGSSLKTPCGVRHRSSLAIVLVRCGWPGRELGPGGAKGEPRQPTIASVPAASPRPARVGLRRSLVWERMARYAASAGARLRHGRLIGLPRGRCVPCAVNVTRASIRYAAGSYPADGRSALRRRRVPRRGTDHDHRRRRSGRARPRYRCLFRGVPHRLRGTPERKANNTLRSLARLDVRLLAA